MELPPQITSRNATASDIAFLLALRRETMEQYLAASGADISIASHEARVMYQFECAQILMLGGKPIGLLKLLKSATGWEIIQFQLSASVQGRGIGRSILEELIEQAEAAGMLLGLGVLKINPARRLYERLGFLVVSQDAHQFYMQRAP